MTEDETRIRWIESRAGLTLKELADEYFEVVSQIRTCPSYDLRKPIMKKAEVLNAIGRYRFPENWHVFVSSYPWPNTVPRDGNTPKTENPWDGGPDA